MVTMVGVPEDQRKAPHEENQKSKGKGQKYNQEGLSLKLGT
jgi:hypothetical protein